MSEIATRTVEVSSNQLDTAIEVLSGAARELQLTRFEKFSYRLLMISVDVAAVGLTIFFILAYLVSALHLDEVSVSKAMGESLIKGISWVIFFLVFFSLFVFSVVGSV